MGSFGEGLAERRLAKMEGQAGYTFSVSHRSFELAIENLHRIVQAMEDSEHPPAHRGGSDTVRAGPDCGCLWIRLAVQAVARFETWAYSVVVPYSPAQVSLVATSSSYLT